MHVPSKQLIEDWFANHADDGEFVSGMAANPYSVIASRSDDGPIVLTTKPATVATAIENRQPSAKLGMIGRYGLPSKTEVRWICEAIGPREALFLGDMDPADLLIFAWLRVVLHPKQIAYVGVNDAFLRALQITSLQSLSIQLAPSEQESLAFLETVFPDFRETVGRQCARMLEGGDKIELEAVASAAGEAASILQPLPFPH